MSLTVEQLLAGNPRIVSLPTLHTRLTAAIDDPGTAFSRIGQIIREDTGFTARLLRIANSALYNFPAPIETVESAMSIIGTRQLRDLALATTVLRLFAGLENTQVSMENFWRHSLCCAAAARVIAILRREGNVERYFTLGILHDVGRLLMYQQLGDRCAQALARARRERRLLHAVEFEQFGFDHAYVGQCLLRQWQLPHPLQEAVGCHHRPRAAQHYPLDAAILHVADWLTNALQAGTSGERFVPPLHPLAWQRLDLAASLLPTMLEYTGEQYRTAVQLFLNGV